MNIQRFTAATSREALAKARLAFGEGTLILSNRPTEHGIEVVATGEDMLAALTPGGNRTNQNQPSQNNKGRAPDYAEAARQIEEDAEQLTMSTLSFQDYVRERMLRRKHESAQPAAKTTILPAPVETARVPTLQRISLDNASASKQHPAPLRKPQSHVPPSAAPQSMMNELHAMKELIEDRFNTLNWLGQARQNPTQSNLMLKMIRAGYSPTLSRTILERLPENMDPSESLRWVIDVLERNLRTDAGSPALYEEGGVFALIGATGVGKTTTAAKLAGLCAKTHGPGSVGLITLDTYRVGAHEQLRAYGKMLGVVAHLAHDKAALQDLLGLLSSKKMVLIDTSGIAPRDPRKRELVELLDLPRIKRLLVINAGGHGDTLDEAIGCFKTPTHQQAILSKTDEAVKLGPVIDAAIRHQLLLRGVTNGQRVPEDWAPAIAAKLVRTSLQSAAGSVHDPKIADLGFYFSHANTHSTGQGRLNA